MSSLKLMQGRRSPKVMKNARSLALSHGSLKTAFMMDCLFNSNEKRLARILLSLTQCRRGSRTGHVDFKLSQQTLAHGKHFKTAIAWLQWVPKLGKRFLEHNRQIFWASGHFSRDR